MLMVINRSVKAFTIIELVVSLMISSIVIVIAYNGLVYFQRSFEVYYKKTLLRQNVALLQKALANDIQESASWQVSENHLDFYSADLKQRLSSYILSGDFIVRNGFPVIDTFFVQSKIKSVIKDNIVKSAVREVILDVLLDTCRVPIIIKKEYSSRDLFSLEIREDEQQD